MNYNSVNWRLLRALVIRPSPFAEQLVTAIKQQQGYAYALPMQQIIAAKPKLILEQINSSSIDYAIVTSRFAAIHAIPTLKQHYQQFNCIKKWFCLGAGTASELSKFAIIANYSKLGITSEHLLQLNDLNIKNTSAKNIAIIKGMHGRNTLYNTLKNQQANIMNLECYSREPLSYPQHKITTILQTYNLNCIICGNNEALKNFCNFLPMGYRNKYKLILPSLRQLELAKKLGFSNSLYSNGISVDGMTSNNKLS